MRDVALLYITDSTILATQAYEIATSRSLFLPVAGVSDDLGQLSRMVKFLGDFPPGVIEASSPFSLKYFESDGIFLSSFPRNLL